MSANTSEALLPCPFCGMQPVFDDPRDGNPIGAVCPEGSPCRGSRLFVCFDTDSRETAIRAWNTRAQSAELASARNESAALRARCDAAEKDAERYRRLRAPDAYKSVRVLFLKEGRWYQSDGDCYLDNNVDALTAERAKEGETRK